MVDSTTVWLLWFLFTVVRHTLEYFLSLGINSLSHMIILLVVTLISAGLVLTFIAFESDSIRMKIMLAAIVLGVAFDLMSKRYPSSGCLVYLTALLFFVTSEDVRSHTVYVSGGVLAIITSSLGFMLGYRA